MATDSDFTSFCLVGGKGKKETQTRRKNRVGDVVGGGREVGVRGWRVGGVAVDHLINSIFTQRMAYGRPDSILETLPFSSVTPQ